MSCDWWRAGHVTPVLTSDWSGAAPRLRGGGQQGEGGAGVSPGAAQLRGGRQEGGRQDGRQSETEHGAFSMLISIRLTFATLGCDIDNFRYFLLIYFFAIFAADIVDISNMLYVSCFMIILIHLTFIHFSMPNKVFTSAIFIPYDHFHFNTFIHDNLCVIILHDYIQLVSTKC